MKSKSFFWAKILGVTTFLVVEAYLVGCGKIDGLPAPASPGAIPGLPAVPPNPPVGIPSEADGFYVQHIQNTSYTYVSHKGNATMTTPCKAAVGELATCYIEGAELDFFVQGLGIQYNVPPSMCSYFRMVPYYYFQRPAGQGPTTAKLDTDTVGNTGDLGPNPPGPFVVTAYKVPTCAFNYTVEGINCCGGTYTQTSRVWDATATAYKTSTTSNLSWGGNPANCLSGPAMKTQPKDTRGRPLSGYQYVGGTGLNKVYAVDAPQSIGKSTNVHVANFFDPADFTGSANQPQAHVTVTDGTFSYPTNRIYDFFCMDTAEEVIAEIQLNVRSWTKKSNFLDLVANPGLYQVSGAEPSPWNVGYDFFDRNTWFSYRNPGGSPVGFPYGTE